MSFCVCLPELIVADRGFGRDIVRLEDIWSLTQDFCFIIIYTVASQLITEGVANLVF